MIERWPVYVATCLDIFLGAGYIVFLQGWCFGFWHSSYAFALVATMCARRTPRCIALAFQKALASIAQVEELPRAYSIASSARK